MAASSTIGAMIATDRKLDESASAGPGVIRVSSHRLRTIETMTATDAPHRNARTSSRGGSGSHRSSHR